MLWKRVPQTRREAQSFNTAEEVEERICPRVLLLFKGILLLYTVLVRSTIFSSKGCFINRSIQQRKNQYIQSHQRARADLISAVANSLEHMYFSMDPVVEKIETMD